MLRGEGPGIRKWGRDIEEDQTHLMAGLIYHSVILKPGNAARLEDEATEDIQPRKCRFGHIHRSSSFKQRVYSNGHKTKPTATKKFQNSWLS